MDTILLICMLGFVVLGGLLIFGMVPFRKEPEEQTLVPFAVMPVTNAEPSTKAFLELYAGQIAWMDSSMLRSVILVYEDENHDAAALCQELSRQYDFFSCMSLCSVQNLLAVRLRQ